jgi:hypothetical protein
MKRCKVDRVKDATALSQKLIFLTVLGWAGAASAQTWTPALQLTDGSILIQEFQNPNWWKLTPTNKAKYHGGKLTKVASFPASMNYAPEFFASAVLPDQLNGLSQGAAFGDDAQSATNYPITNNATGHKYFARTHGHSTMGVATGSFPTSTSFTVLPGTETSDSTRAVIANGIPSNTVGLLYTDSSSRVGGGYGSHQKISSRL